MGDHLGSQLQLKSYLLGHDWVLQLTILVLLLTPEHDLAPLPEGRGLVHERVSLTLWQPDPQVLEHVELSDSPHCDHPPCTVT